MKVFLSVSLIGAALIAAPALAASTDQQALPVPDWQLDDVQVEKTSLEDPEFAGENHTDSLLQRQMRQLEKLREQAERDAERVEKLKKLQEDS